MAKAEKRSPEGEAGQTSGQGSHLEVEVKYDVPPGFLLPDLGGLEGVSSVAQPRDDALDATYFDTDDLRLIANKLTLRRRTGGPDAGWHLKLPAARGRQELHEPLGRATRTVPPPLRRHVEVHARGKALKPVVRLQTRRATHELLGADGAVLAEVAVDEVSASSPRANGRATTVQAWSEVEVELVGGDDALLAAVGDRLREAGATPSHSPSKLARALADRLPAPVEVTSAAAEPAPPPAADEGRGKAKGKAKGGSKAKAKGKAGKGMATPAPADPARDVVMAYLAEQVTQLKRQDPLVRLDEHDAVHQMRVACRRMRSALATFRPLFDRQVTDPIRVELQWLGTELGGARDAEVVRDHLRGMAEAEPADLLMGPVVSRIVTTMTARYRAAHDEALEQLSAKRYFALLDTLDALVDHPPLTELAQRPAPQALLPLVRKTWRRTRDLVIAADAAADPAQREVLLHDVRKAAKRARYAGESVSDRFGKPALDFAKRMSAVQTVLGDHQDSVVVRQVLRELAVAACGDGENAFSYGRLHALEQVRGEESERQFQDTWDRASQPAVRAWLG